jgi:hypothetical protein
MPAGANLPASQGSSTGPASGPAGGPSTLSTPVPRRAARAPFVPFAPIIDVNVDLTEPGEPFLYSPSSEIPGHHQSSQLANFYQQLDVGGTVKIPITRSLSASFDRIIGGLIDQPLSREIINGVPAYPAVTRDVILQYRVTDQINRYFNVEAGLSFRHRAEAGGYDVNGTPFGDNGVSTAAAPYSYQSTEHHFGYLAFGYVTRPVKGLLNSSFTFREALDTQKIDHNVTTTGCTAAQFANPNYSPSGDGSRCAAVGVIDEQPGRDRWYQTTQTAGIIVPIDAKHGTSFLYSEGWGALNFYENYPTPFRYTSSATLQLNKKFNNFMSVAIRHQDLHQTQQGTPLPYPNVVHPEAWDVIGTFHFDTGSMFR